MKQDKILNKAKFILETNKESTSIYYKELKKIYKEFKSLKNKDKTTIDLYLTKISNLCDLLDEKTNANRTISMVIITLIVMFGLMFYSVIKYQEIKIDKENYKNTTLIVEYKNLSDFNPLTLSTKDTYQNLEPLRITVSATSKDNIKHKLHYDIYLISYNDDVLKQNIYYNAVSTKIDTGIKRLDHSIINDNRMLLYSNDIECGNKQEVLIKMWTLKEELLNYNFNYEIYVDSYEI